VYPSARYGPSLDATPGEIGAPALWGPGLETAGDGVKIGIIDTGIDPTHPFFDPTGYAMPAGFPKGQRRFTTAKVIVARAFPPPGAGAPSAGLAFDRETAGHGTHVAGIAAGNAQTHASGGAVVSGVAPRAYLGNYKALVETDSGLSPNGNSPELVAAIEAAVRDGMDVVNLSLGEPEIEPRRDIVARALDAAAAAGIVPVVAAGNDFNDAGAGSVSSPASSVGAISVGAVEGRGGTPATFEHASFSSVGPTTISLRLKPDVVAPGVGVLSSVPGGGWSRVSGTSMASPHVAGAAALLRQRHPAWKVAQIKSALVQTGRDALGESAGPVTPAFQGGGVVTLGRADQPLVFADPTALSFGLLVPGSVVQAVVSLADAGGGAGAWDVAAVRAGASGALATPRVPATVVVPGTLPVEVAVPAAARGELTGYLELRRGGDVRRIPYWGRVTTSALARSALRPLMRPGLFHGTTAGRPARVTRYRYPEDPRGLGAATFLRGPELVYRFRLTRRVANFGVVVLRRAPGVGIEPRVVAGLDENRLTGYAGLPVAHNPYLESFRDPVLAAGALSPLPGEYGIVFDSPARAGAGRFTFRFWVHDVTPPTLRLRTRSVRRGDPILVSATDRGSGVYPGGIVATVDGLAQEARLRDDLVRVSTEALSPGRHRLRLRVSDYQEAKNTENVARILPNTRVLTATVVVRRG
jgi:subtilisin family serine protease